MAPAYQIRIYNTLGERVVVLGLQRDVRSMVIEHRVNYASTLQLGLYLNSPAVPYFTLDALITVWRRVPEAGLDWYPEYVGFHRTPEEQITEADSEIFTSYGRGLLDLVNRASIRYYADTNGSAKGPAAADNIIKAFVRENIGTLALVSNGRLVDHVFPGVTVAADLSEAASIETTNPWQNLLGALRSIGEPNSVDFDMVWGGEADPLSFLFETYHPQLGTDRRESGSNPFVFAPELGNMARPTRTVQRTDEISSVLVLGPGESVNRDTTLRLSTHTADSPWNLIEQDQDASNEDRAAALEAIGDEVLFNKRPAVSFNFGPIQTPTSAYGKDYFLGDIVTGHFKEVSTNVKILSVTITLQEGGAENINLELKEVTS